MAADDDWFEAADGNGDGGDANGGGPPASGDGGPEDPFRQTKRRLKKLRLLAVLTGFGALALVSMVFGMLMSVASDIPQLENLPQYQHQSANSALYDDRGRLIGILEPPTHAVFDKWQDISHNMVNAVIAVEDKRFWTEPGIDLRGIGRAILSDVTGGSRQGASTITEQFVKNALNEQNNRTVFEKIREAALAFHLTHRWRKTKIMDQYLNSVYFGNGAYGIEQAARVYFGKQLGYDVNAATDNGQPRCGDSTPTLKLPKCAQLLDPAQAALLAGMISSPAAYDPIANSDAARARRKIALTDMLNQRDIDEAQYNEALGEPLPTSNDIQQPAEPTAAPYFTSWLRPQILRALGYRSHATAQQKFIAQYRAFYGGLKIHTTLDLSLQQAADQAVEQVLPYGTGMPTASLVAIDNKTGEVRAMVGGPIVNGQEDFQHYPFNLATQGHRQPGSAFKPFTLAVALEDGIGPDSVWASAPQDFIVPNSGGKEHFIVHNFGNQYSGSISLQGATDVSDNSVFAQVGIHVGTDRIATLAKHMGIRSPVSNNYAMILGGLREGVSPLDMAHAYETFATGGLKVWNPQLGDFFGGPIGIHEIDCSSCSTQKLVNHPQTARILPAPIAQEEAQMLQGPVTSGTATQAAIPGVAVSGKTGTTTNYADAWFVGWTPQLTVAVWVGFPNKLIPMNTLYNGQPVEGGTFPAIIWHAFMVNALQTLAQEAASSNHGQTTTLTTPLSAPVVPAGPTTTPAATGAGTTTTPATGTGGGNKPTGPTTGGGTGGGTQGGGTQGGGTQGGGTQGGGTQGGGTQGGGAGGGTGGGGTGGTGIP